MKNWYLQSLCGITGQLAVTTAAPFVLDLPQGMVGSMTAAFVGTHLPNFCQAFLPGYSKYKVFYQAASSVAAMVAMNQLLVLDSYSITASSIPVLIHLVDGLRQLRSEKKRKQLLSIQDKLDLPDLNVRKRLSEVLQRLAETQAVDMPHLVICPSYSNTAYAVPDINTLVITTGFIDSHNNLDQITATMAHEFGHLIQENNSTLLKISEKAALYLKMCLALHGVTFYLAAVMLGFNNPDISSYVMKVASQVALIFLINKFCVGQIRRSEETRADLFAVSLLQQKEPLVDLLLNEYEFNKNQSIEFSRYDLGLMVQDTLFTQANNGNQLCEYLVTFFDEHPSDLQRINDIESWYGQHLRNPPILFHKFNNIEEASRIYKQQPSTKPVICLN